jgi:2-polyprenyl-3-methyl-5-hydroxy-6-metoxy-1,4-benzoquinol methylase
VFFKCACPKGQVSDVRLFKRNRKDHWERIYRKHAPAEVGWHQANPVKSLHLIHKTGAGKDSRIIDVGGGTSKLPQYLLHQGYKKIAVLDISENAIEKAKLQLGELSNRIDWIKADITKHRFRAYFDIWHDRAVFHFLTKRDDRKGYVHSLNQALMRNGHLIIATFGIDGPAKCSGLPVVRYSRETLQNELGDNFHLEESLVEDHVTPSETKQQFIFCRFIKLK